MEYEYDLLNIRDSSFRLVFDLYTPRAHFIIVPKHQRFEVYLSKIGEEKRRELVNMALETKRQFRVAGILSFHCGTWFSQRVFHAHVCVTDVERYLEIYEKYKYAIPQYPSSIQKHFANEKHWPKGKKACDYPANVRAYPSPKTTMKYFRDDLKEIKRNFSEPVSLNNGGANASPPRTAVYESFQLLYGPDYLPRIYFSQRTAHRESDVTAVSMFNCLNAMERFARTHIMARKPEKGNWNNGCHICVYLQPEVIGSTRCDGYLHLSGKKFFDLCPVDERRSWLEGFEMKTEHELKNLT